MVDTSSHEREVTEQILLSVLQELIKELHPSKRQSQLVTIDSSLDTDVGLDSLGRVELISRLEKRFNIVLPQRVFAEAETLRDLLRAISIAREREQVKTPLPVTEYSAEKLDELPLEAQTLIDVLEWHVKRHPERLHIRVLGDEGVEETLTYEQLWHGARQLASGLQAKGIQTGDSIAIMLPTGKEYFFSFYAILLCGAIPVPIYPPVRRSQLEEHLRRHSGILNNCLATTLITFPDVKLVAKLLKSQVGSMREVLTVADLMSGSNDFISPVIGAVDVAFLQYTSGSTGNPKGVVLTHANLLANIRAMGEAVEANSSDVFVSWLPLYHDMGLIGAWLGSLYYAAIFVVMSPLSFLTRPQRWLWAIHQYHGTLSASPNFGYELCLKRIMPEDIKGMDLSRLRLAFNGAEPVSPDTIRKFTERFRDVGFRAETMLPVYGLAESAVGLAFPTLHQEPVIDCVNRERFTQTREAEPAQQGDENALCFVTCGHPLSGHEVRIVDDDGRELPDRQEGFLQFRGPSATSGYFRNPEASKKLFKGEWLESGDLAYTVEGEIFVTGRSKDVIIRAGRNIYPQEIEEAIGNIEGIRKGCVVVFGSREASTSTEQLVVIAETREVDDTNKQAFQKKIYQISNELLGLPPDEVILAPPHTVLKTSSGKLRRSACRDMYEQGLLGKAQKALWLQVLRTLLHSLKPGWQRCIQKLTNSLFAAYAWFVFGSLSVIAWPCVMLLPVLSWRWRALHYLTRALAFFTGIRVMVNGIHNLPPISQTCVYVANHASYLDSMAMIAAIPRAFVYIAKIELKKKISVRLFLQRLRVEFVERFDRQQGLVDAQRLARAAQYQQSLFFFPEGTFSRVPGLRNFYMGAFVTAAECGLPVVPIAIQGTRSILRSGSWFPRRGRITITIGEVVMPEPGIGAEEADRWQQALKLRDAARRHILRYCGEPDLTKTL